MNCNCLQHEQMFSGRLLGKFYKAPRRICLCGHNVLELIICESCGEAFLGGYIVKRMVRHSCLLTNLLG